MDELATKNRPNQLLWEDRKRLSVSGVIQVDRFDEQTVVMQTDLGTLTVKGEELHVDRLSTESGDVTVTGHLCGLMYSGNDGKTSRLAKVFR